MQPFLQTLGWWTVSSYVAGLGSFIGPRFWTTSPLEIDRRCSIQYFVCIEQDLIQWSVPCRKRASLKWKTSHLFGRLIYYTQRLLVGTNKQTNKPTTCSHYQISRVHWTTYCKLVVSCHRWLRKMKQQRNYKQNIDDVLCLLQPSIGRIRNGHCLW